MQKITTMWAVSCLSLIAAAALLLPRFSQAADSSDAQSSSGKKMDDCKQMMSAHEKLMDEVKRGDQKLASLAGQLAQAPEDKKLDLLTKIVTEMVNERATTHEKLEAMHGKMMHHMARHMQQGENSLASCPMMRDMEGMGSPGRQSEHGHAEHHSDSDSSSSSSSSSSSDQDSPKK